MEKRVVVIGGGFAGSKIAKSLEEDFNVTLVDTKDYFEFTPSILSAITEPECLDRIQIMHEHYLKKAQFILGRVEKFSKKEVVIGKEKISYDYLVISSGSKYSFPFKDHDALTAHRADKLRAHYSQLESSKTVLIIGGGLSGVELAGEIVEKYPNKKVTIVHAMDRLMERQPKKASNYVENFLKKKGVKIIFNELVEYGKKKGRGDIYVTNKKNKIQADISFLCVGITPNSDFAKKSFPKLVSKRGYVAVNKFLQLKGHKNIFVGGDVVDIKEEKTAQISLEHAEVIIQNIRNLEAKKALKEYVHEKRAMLMSLGSHAGVMTYKNFVLTGLIPRLLKSRVQNKEMRWLRYG